MDIPSQSLREGGKQQHVASNAYTRYRPYPTPALFAASNDLITRTTIFLRRELQVWDNIDVEFLTTFTISLMKSLDIRSESAVKLLAEFLDLDGPHVEGGRYVNAEHFAHEIYSFVRSPFRDLFVYDSVVQYDAVFEEPSPTQLGRRWGSVHSHSRSCSPARNVGRSRSVSNSPTGRRSPTNDVQQNRESSTNVRGINASCRNQPDKGDTARTNANFNNARDTSRRAGYSTTRKERGREHFAHETAVNHVEVAEDARLEVEAPAGEHSVAHSSDQSCFPVPSPRLSVIRPGHRSLAQSVHTHLKRGLVNQRRGFKGTRPERHLDPLLSAPSNSASATALLAQSSDSLSSPQRTEYGPESYRLVPQRASIHLSSPVELLPHARASTTQGVATTLTRGASTSSVPVPDSRSHPSPSSLMLSFAPLSGGFATTSNTSLHTAAIDSPHQIMSGVHHVVIPSQDNPIDESTRPLISTDVSDADFGSTHLSVRLEREKLRAQCVMAEEITDIPQPMDSSSNTAESLHKQMLSVQSEQVHDGSVNDPHVMETKLRKRAHLQVRLAAEKRSTAV
ncbi:hypothetical protein C0992_006785 [Termitomyces sp. T32_za158]|nr:hypothetical protein C0992_006785 [Termitomyces sp. T32_za158]